jgi:hypothetical protein
MQQFLGGIATGVQGAGQAAQNWAIKQQDLRAGQSLDLEREKMLQQGQQFEQGLQAEAENYRKLNESRERMQTQELGQQGAQFKERMSFDREQARVERLLTMKMKQIDMELMRNEQEIAAMADNDPRLQQARSKRIKMKQDLMNLEETMGSMQTGMQLAQGVRSDRLDEVDARLLSMKEGWTTRRNSADQAFSSGLDMAMLKGVREGGFWDQVGRVQDATQAMLFADGTGEQRQTAGLANSELSNFSAAYRIVEDNVLQFFGVQGDPTIAQAKATEFEKNGSVMAAQVVHNALELRGEAFGLDKGNKAKGAAVAAQIVADASLLANVGNRLPPGDGKREELRARIANGVKELRSVGMGDEQIDALFDGLQGMYQNQAEVLTKYAANDRSGKPEILQSSLDGVGKIYDQIQGVVNDGKLMQGAGGKLVDYSKYNWGDISKRARLAYGLQGRPEVEQLSQELEALQIPEAERLKLIKLVTESDPNLQYLRPEDFASAIRGIGRQQRLGGLEYETTNEDIGQLQGQIVAQGRLQGLSEADRKLAEAIGLAGG